MIKSEICIKFFNINDMREREERERFSTTGLINVQGFVESELKRQKNYLICLPADRTTRNRSLPIKSRSILVRGVTAAFTMDEFIVKL